MWLRVTTTGHIRPFKPLAALSGAMSAPDLDPEQLDRYSRHIIMDEIGPAGQAAMLDPRA